MLVYSSCKQCNKELSFRTGSPSRMEYSKEYDDYKTLRCECGRSNKFHLDELHARESNLNTFLALIFSFSICLMIFFLSFFSLDGYIVIGVFILIPIVVYGTIRKQEQSNVSSWNRIKINNRRTN